MTDYRKGEILWTLGLDEQCHKTIEMCWFVRNHADGRIVVRCTDGLMVITDAGSVYKSRHDVIATMMKGGGR